MRWYVLLLLLLVPGIHALGLPYFQDDSNHSNFWIKVNLSAGETKTFQAVQTPILITTSNGSQIFPLFFDDFTNDSITNSQWRRSDGGNAFDLTSSGRMLPDGRQIVSHQNFSNNLTLVSAMSMHPESAVLNSFGLVSCWDSSDCNHNNISYLFWNEPGGTNFEFFTKNHTNASETHFAFFPSAGNPNVTLFIFPPNWALAKIKTYTSGLEFFYGRPYDPFYNYSAFRDVVNTQQLSETIDKSIFMEGSSPNMYVEWVGVYPTITQEPIVTAVPAGIWLDFTITNPGNTAVTEFPVLVLNMTVQGNFLVDTNVTQYFNQTFLAQPKFIDTPYFFGDTPRAASIFQNRKNFTGTVHIEWYVNSSILVKNETVNVNQHQSFESNISSNYTVPGTNITVSMYANTSLDLTPRKNASIAIALPQCSDTIDNDNDTFIDFPNDSDCGNALDNSEAPTATDSSGATCTITGGGGSYSAAYSAIYTVPTTGGTLSEEQQLNLFQETLQLFKTELCGNGLDDNQNGFIDENCPKTIKVTTSNFQKRYNLLIKPGTERSEDVFVTNLGTQLAMVQMSCEGQGCLFISFDPTIISVTPNNLTYATTHMHITLPLTLPVNAKYAVRIVGTDTTQSGVDNIVLSITTSESQGILKSLEESLNTPIFCTGFSTTGAKNICIPIWLPLTFLLTIGIISFALWKNKQ